MEIVVSTTTIYVYPQDFLNICEKTKVTPLIHDFERSNNLVNLVEVIDFSELRFFSSSDIFYY